MKLWRNILMGMTMVVVVVSFAPSAGAFGGGYIPGLEGALAPTLPPPGLHYKQYNIFIDSSKLNDPDGDELDIGFGATVFAQAHRFAYFTKKHPLGADDYGMSIVIPVVAKDIEIRAAGSEDSAIGLGDLFIEPVIMGWHTERWDLALGLGAQFATGNWRNSNEAANGEPGSGGYHNGLITLGATYYFDEAKSWTISALSRTVLYFGEQDETDYQPGDEFVIDWGIAKQFAVSKNLLVRPAVVGYTYWQYSDDKNRYDGFADDDRGTKYAVGAELNFFWLPRLIQFNLRYLQDVEAEDEFEATTLLLSIISSF
jgi:hypothetical protein